MRIIQKDYPIIKHLVTGQQVKIAHEGCSNSKCLSIKMDVEGYLFHCFKCGDSGFLAHESTTFRDRKLREAEKAAYQREQAREGWDLPSDFSYKIGNAGLAWLGSGGWPSDLIVQHKVGWSDYLSRVVFTVRPLGWIARAVHDDQVPKYLAKGQRGQYWVSEPIVDRVCVVEDILSAGRVGQVYPAMAMLGTDQWNTGILARAKEVAIWTDNDRAGRRCRTKLNSMLQWFPDTRVFNVTSDKDPKTYTTEEIIQLIINKRKAYV